MDDNLVWEVKLDGLYDCSVVRLKPALGELRVSRRTGEPLGVGLVTFSYSAMFGPDVDDVADWQAWIMEFIEGEPSARNPLRPTPSVTSETMTGVERDVPDDLGCEYCRNDGRLIDGRCPKCDAEYPDEDD